MKKIALPFAAVGSLIALFCLLIIGPAWRVSAHQPAVPDVKASDIAPKMAAPATPHPLAYVGVRLHMRGVLHKQGYGIIHVNRMIAGLDDATIDTMAQQIPSATDPAYPLLLKVGTGQVTPAAKLIESNRAAQPPPVEAAIGGGGFFATLLADIAAFFATPQGKALEGALVTALIALITGA